MSEEIEQLVRDVREVTGAAPPLVLEQTAPILDDEARQRGTDGGFYLVGLVGGKEVGKSALVNALVGKSITEQTSHGPGTQGIIAYAHASQETAVRELLTREAAGKFRIVTHHEPHLQRQVLIDLPDVDSHWDSHLELTRSMLRQMLFPLWITSIEKYADQRVMDMLRRVAQGNSPENFIFCLNKVDQVSGPESRVEELREDYARRLQDALELEQRPGIRLISATHPDQYELPKLKALLSREKAPAAVELSAERAGWTKTASVVRWLGEQNLPARAQRLARLQSAAEELVQDRVGTLALEQAVSMVEDPGRRLELVDEAQKRRVARWPIVNVLHVLLSPLLPLIRENLRGPHTYSGGAAPDQQRLSAEVAGTFAQLHQEDLEMASLYRHWKLWEPMEANAAGRVLAHQLEETSNRQKQLVRERIGGKDNVVAGAVRFLLTIGAIIWFILAQPLLEAYLRSPGPNPFVDVALLAVQILSATALLKNATFLIIYFLALWLLIRWSTQRRVDRLLNRCVSAPDPLLNPSAVAMEWMRDLIRPIRDARAQMEMLAQREQELRRSNAA